MTEIQIAILSRVVFALLLTLVFIYLSRLTLSKDDKSMFHSLHKDSREIRFVVILTLFGVYLLLMIMIIKNSFDLINELLIMIGGGGTTGAGANVLRKFAPDQKIITEKKIQQATESSNEELKDSDVIETIDENVYDTIVGLNRFEKISDRTIGRMSIERSFSGVELDLVTIEDKYIDHIDADGDGKSDNKVWGENCIPNGLYELVINKYKGKTWRFMSKHDWFEYVIELVGVPFYSGIQVHIGNDIMDTNGCICPNMRVKVVSRKDDEGKERFVKIGESSTKANEIFYKTIYPLLKQGKRVAIRIK